MDIIIHSSIHIANHQIHPLPEINKGSNQKEIILPGPTSPPSWQSSFHGLPCSWHAWLKLIRKCLLSGLLSLGLVDTLHEHPLVLEHVTLNLHVHVMVHVLVNFLGFTVLEQQAPKNMHPPHPQNLGGELSLAGAPALTFRKK